MHEDRVESNASFIALPSDQLFDDIQTSTSQQKRRRIVPQSPPDSDSVDQFLKDVPEIASNFTITSKIGTGTFSTVYLACLKKDPSKYFALKHIVETSAAWRIENELKCLTLLSDNDYVMSLETYVRHNDHVVLVMPFFDHQKFQDYVDDVTVREIQEYMKCLFAALKAVHSYNIIHRDVKPSNFLYNRKERKFKLVDFGLAQTEPGYKDQVGPSYKADHTILKGAINETVSGIMPSRAVRMSPRLAKKRNSQLRGASGLPTATPTTMLWSHKENTVAVAASVSGGHSVTTSNQQPHIAASRKPVGRGRRAISSSVGVARSTRTSRRGSSKCNHTPAEICNHCIQRLGQKSPRAGTPGFRPPEVLLKYPNQTTAVDIWSAGVILLCLLSGKYPFFKASDDLTTMMQIVNLMGSHECAEAAKQFGKELTCAPPCPAQELSRVCQQLRAALMKEKTLPKSQPGLGIKLTGKRALALRKLPGAGDSTSTHDNTRWTTAPDEAYDLLKRCLDLNPLTRITANDALYHPFLKDTG